MLKLIEQRVVKKKVKLKFKKNLPMLGLKEKLEGGMNSILILEMLNHQLNK